MFIHIFFIALGFILAFLFSVMSSFKIEPVHNLYYLFAWWPYIFIIDGAVYLLKKESLIITRTKHFILMLPASAAIWFIFELFNLRLQNWHYLYLPQNDYLRYFGYMLSYATVLPAIFETAELIGALKIFDGLKIRALNIDENILKKTFYFGIILFLLVLIFPKYFFAFIWVCFILIIEPINFKLGAVSLIRDLRSARWNKLFSLGLSGLVCGFLWEMWNFNSGAKWKYTVNFVGDLKLFEMPLPGYLGFIFFAIECYCLYNLICYLKGGENWENIPQKPNKLNGILFVLLYLLFIPLYMLSIKAIDSYTVKMFVLIPL